jgi:riboflavin synthase
VEELGEVLNQRHYKESSGLLIKGKKVMEGMKAGDSVAVNGVCLTVTGISHPTFNVDIMPETLRKTNLHQCKAGEKVNLERALPAGGRLGGHFVSGHIDGTGRVASKRREGNALILQIDAPGEIMRYVIERGSLAVDGVSLTAIDVQDSSFAVSLIPHTAEQTTLAFKKRGDTVNLEADLLAKYLEKLLLLKAVEKKSPGPGGAILPLTKTERGITHAFLREKGFF